MSTGARWLGGLAVLCPTLLCAQSANDESAVLETVKGTVYVRSIPASAGNGNGNRQCGFDFLVIARDPASGQAVQLKGRFLASRNEQGARYGWSGVLYEGLRPEQAGRAPGRISLQPVNGMRVKQPLPINPGAGETLEYREPVDAEFQLLLSSIVRDGGLKVGFSREPDGALIETTLDMDVSDMQLRDGRAMRQFDSRVPPQMARCWGSSGS